MVSKELDPKVREAVQAYLAEHHDVIDEVIRDTVGKGFLRILTDYIETKTSGPLFTFAEQLRQQGVLR
jgi:hypothetical protein